MPIEGYKIKVDAAIREAKGTFLFDPQAFGLVVSLNERRPLASAFAFLNRNWCVTAKHVVVIDGVVRDDLIVQTLGISRRVVSTLTAGPLDVAVLVLEAPICSMPFMPVSEPFIGGRMLISLGYSPQPLDETEVIKHVTLPEAVKSADDQGMSPRLYLAMIDRYNLEHRGRGDLDEELIVFAAPSSTGGNSGGPVITETGGVVALIIEQVARGDELLVYATSVMPVVGQCELRAKNS